MTNSKLLWLFDLDNTLHNASHAIFPAINANMNAFMAQVLSQDGVLADDKVVNKVRLDYWRRYGATLLGLVKHHQVQPEAFLREAHRFDDLTAMIRAERGLGRFLSRLPGRKILLTNAPYRYSKDVMLHLGLHRHFGKHIAIESMRVHRQIRPKPSKHLLRKLIAQEGVVAKRCILVEDTLDTLKAAKKLGMKTAWVTNYLKNSEVAALTRSKMLLSLCVKRPAYVDVKVRSVQQLAKNLHRLR